MKTTYTPSLEALNRQYGARYFTVTTCKRGHKATAAADYGTLEDIVNTADALIFNEDPAADVPRAFRHALRRLGVSFYPGRTVTEYDGDLYEIIDRKTGEPLFVAIPQEV